MKNWQHSTTDFAWARSNILLGTIGNWANHFYLVTFINMISTVLACNILYRGNAFGGATNKNKPQKPQIVPSNDENVNESLLWKSGKFISKAAAQKNILPT